MKNQIEDKDEEIKEKLMDKLEKGKYDKNLVEEDSTIREGQIQDTKLWRKFQKYVEYDWNLQRFDILLLIIDWQHKEMITPGQKKIMMTLTEKAIFMTIQRVEAYWSHKREREKAILHGSRTLQRRGKVCIVKSLMLIFLC